MGLDMYWLADGEEIGYQRKVYLVNEFFAKKYGHENCGSTTLDESMVEELLDWVQMMDDEYTTNTTLPILVKVLLAMSKGKRCVYESDW